MNRTEMDLKKAIFFQYFTVVRQFVLQFVKIDKVNIKHTRASPLQIPLRSNAAYILFNWKFLISTKTQAGKGILLFPNMQYTSLENSRYETLGKKVIKVTGKMFSTRQCNNWHAMGGGA